MTVVDSLTIINAITIKPSPNFELIKRFTTYIKKLLHTMDTYILTLILSYLPFISIDKILDILNIDATASSKIKKIIYYQQVIITHSNGETKYMIDDYMHREDGPAWLFPDGSYICKWAPFMVYKWQTNYLQP